MRVSIGRALLVTVGLSAIGVIAGIVLGGIAVLIDFGPHIREAEMGGIPGAFGFGATLGASYGAVVAPIIGWIFLRRASLGRAIAETALGTLAGMLTAAALPSRPIYLLAFIGFLAAAIRLWVATRPAAERRAPAA
jgi:hypothetical protein